MVGGRRGRRISARLRCIMQEEKDERRRRRRSKRRRRKRRRRRRRRRIMNLRDEDNVVVMRKMEGSRRGSQKTAKIKMEKRKEGWGRSG